MALRVTKRFESGKKKIRKKSAAIKLAGRSWLIIMAERREHECGMEESLAVLILEYLHAKRKQATISSFPTLNVAYLDKQLCLVSATPAAVRQPRFCDTERSVF